MSAIDDAKEIIRLATTAGLGKDVIDLQEAKLRIITDELSQAQIKIGKLEIENRQLKTQIQNSQPNTSGFHEYMGTLWKRMAKGYEPNPYCKECSHHPIMTGNPPVGDPFVWQCSNGHTAPFAGRPK